MELTDLLPSILSGLLASIITLVVTLVYQWRKSKKEKIHFLAKERLGRVYGPLLLILNARKIINKNNQEQFLYSKEEEKIIDKLLLKNYYLIEDKRKGILLNLYGYRKYGNNSEQQVFDLNKEVVRAIKEGFEDNRRML
jgi:hypothetical protein